MLDAYEINQAVEAGKKEALDFINKNLRISADEASHINPKIRTLLALAMKKSELPLDVAKLRQTMFVENRNLLAKIDANSPDITLAFASVLGRVTLIRECMEATGRIAATLEPGDTIFLHLHSFFEFLQECEKASVKLRIDYKDALVTSKLQETAPEFMASQTVQAA